MEFFSVGNPLKNATNLLCLAVHENHEKLKVPGGSGGLDQPKGLTLMCPAGNLEVFTFLVFRKE